MVNLFHKSEKTGKVTEYKFAPYFIVILPQLDHGTLRMENQRSIDGGMVPLLLASPLSILP
jgi:hypothetical protein